MLLHNNLLAGGFPMSRRAVVTGGAGFVGSHLCEALARDGWKVVAFDDFSTGSGSNLRRARSMGVEEMRMDITGSDLEAAMMKSQPQVVFHLAAVSSVMLCENNQKRCREVNVEGTVRVLEAACRSGAEKLVNISSLAVHGVVPHCPGSSYGMSKQAAEEYLMRKAPSAGIRWVTLRPANVYGPRQPGDGESAVVAAWLEAMARGGSLFLDGDGQQTRDFLYVEDAVGAVVAAADRGDGLALDLGRGVETSLLSLLEIMRDITGWSENPRRRPARPGDIRRSVVDPRSAQGELGWKARTDLVAGLRRTWEWMAAG